MINMGIDEGKWYYWAITPKGNPQLVGTICLWNFNKTRTVAEIGYELHPAHQGKGIMQPAIETVVNFAFETLGLETVIAVTHNQNLASIKLLEKHGFTETTREDTMSTYSLKRG